MKTKSVALLFALTASLCGLGLFAAEKAAAKPVPGKKPVLKIDAAPVSEIKSPLVTSYADVLDQIRPAVVSVYSSKNVRQQVPEFLRQYGVQGGEQKQRGLGSGVIISTDGYIITNNHVVEEADELKVLLNDEREYTAKIIGTDPKTDVAVIKIDVENLPAATLADSAKLRVGDIVFAIGNPLGVGQTVTMGIVSATGRRGLGLLDEVAGYEDFIQTDAAINQGNSGGALIDAHGRLVGINSAILSTSQGNIGIGFAIPVNLASSIMNSLIETGTVSRGFMGVSTDPKQLTSELAERFGAPKDTKGVLITEVTPDGPADKAGLKRDDIVTSLNAKPVTTGADLRLIVAQMIPGTKVTVNYLREGKALTSEVTLAKRPDENDAEGEFLSGVSVTALNSELRKQLRIDDRVDGLVITDITDSSPYRESFAEGAVIVQLNRVPVNDLTTARKALREGRNLAFVYYRGVYRYVMFTVR